MLQLQHCEVRITDGRNFVNRLITLMFVAALAGCASGVDRYGRPIDGWKPLTRETAPDPGRKPSEEEARRIIRPTLTERQGNLVLRSMREVSYVMPFGQVRGGWLVCFTVSGTNVFGQPFVSTQGLIIRSEETGELGAYHGGRARQNLICGS
jgi:hypothetical protein